MPSIKLFPATPQCLDDPNLNNNNKPSSSNNYFDNINNDADERNTRNSTFSKASEGREEI
jgi:hypothetical protein